MTAKRDMTAEEERLKRIDVIYRCDHCGARLPAGVRVCPACGEEFEGLVPADAEAMGLGFTAAPTAQQKTRTVPRSTGLNRIPAMKWLDPPAPRGAPATLGAWGRALLVLAVIAVIVLAVHYVR